MLMYGLNEAIDPLATANSVKWYVDVLSSVDSNALRKRFDVYAKGEKKKWRLKKNMEEAGWGRKRDVGRIEQEDELCQPKWIFGVNRIAIRLRWIWPPSLVEDTTRY